MQPCLGCLPEIKTRINQLFLNYLPLDHVIKLDCTFCSCLSVSNILVTSRPCGRNHWSILINWELFSLLVLSNCLYNVKLCMYVCVTLIMSDTCMLWYDWIILQGCEMESGWYEIILQGCMMGGGCELYYRGVWWSGVWVILQGCKIEVEGCLILLIRHCTTGYTWMMWCYNWLKLCVMWLISIINSLLRWFSYSRLNASRLLRYVQTIRLQR